MPTAVGYDRVMPATHTTTENLWPTVAEMIADASDVPVSAVHVQLTESTSWNFDGTWTS